MCRPVVCGSTCYQRPCVYMPAVWSGPYFTKDHVHAGQQYLGGGGGGACTLPENVWKIGVHLFCFLVYLRVAYWKWKYRYTTFVLLVFTHKTAWMILKKKLFLFEFRSFIVWYFFLQIAPGLGVFQFIIHNSYTDIYIYIYSLGYHKSEQISISVATRHTTQAL